MNSVSFASKVINDLASLQNKNQYAATTGSSPLVKSDRQIIILGKDDSQVSARPSGVFAKISAFFSDWSNGRTRNIEELGSRVSQIFTVLESSKNIDSFVVESSDIEAAKIALLGLQKSAKSDEAKKGFGDAIKTIDRAVKKKLEIDATRQEQQQQATLRDKQAQEQKRTAKVKAEAVVKAKAERLARATAFADVVTSEPQTIDEFIAGMLHKMCAKSPYNKYTNLYSLSYEAARKDSELTGTVFAKDGKAFSGKTALNESSQRALAKHFQDQFDLLDSSAKHKRSDSTSSTSSNGSSSDKENTVRMRTIPAATPKGANSRDGVAQAIRDEKAFEVQMDLSKLSENVRSNFYAALARTPSFQRYAKSKVGMHFDTTRVGLFFNERNEITRANVTFKSNSNTFLVGETTNIVIPVSEQAECLKILQVEMKPTFDALKNRIAEMNARRAKGLVQLPDGTFAQPIQTV